MPRVVILDRDGTLVVDHGYLDDPDRLQLLPGAVAGLRRLRAQGHRLIIVTNQSGVGRGMFSLERLREINDRLTQMLRTSGVDIEGIYSCPHHPDDHCGCRKPETGLVRRAAAELGFEPRECIVIGDQHGDVELGRRLGAITLQVSAQIVTADERSRADYVIRDLLAAADVIESIESDASGTGRARAQ